MACVRTIRLVRSTRQLTLSAASFSLRTLSTTQQPVQFTPVEMTDDHMRRLVEKDEAMRKAYDRVPDVFPEHSQASGEVIDKEAAFRKRLLYRSKQRGWLEVDLLMGTWADKHLSTLSGVELHEYERILNAETIDLYNIVTGKQDAPQHLDGPIMRKIVAWAKDAPLGKADPAAYARVKRIFSN